MTQHRAIHQHAIDLARLHALHVEHVLEDGVTLGVGREALLGIPSLEAIIFRRCCETKLLFEDLLPFGTEQEIGKQ